MLLDNKTKNTAIDFFEKTYSYKVIKICNVLSKHTITVLSKNDYENSELSQLVQDFDYSNSPWWFASNGSNNEYAIVVDEDFCNRLHFSDIEMMACLAHEIGHIIYLFHKEYDDKDEAQKEFMADGYALRIGLGKPLLSVIRKLKEFNNRQHKQNWTVLDMRIELLQMGIKDENHNTF